MNIHKTHSRGLTVIELVIGMTITTMVAGAVAAVLTSVSQGWTHSQDIQTQTSLTTQSLMRVNRVVRDCKQIGATRAGGISGTVTTPAAALIWRADLNSDEQIQFSELALLEHDPDGDSPNDIPLHAIVWWTVQFPAGWTSAQKAAADSIISDASLYSDAEITAFRNNFSALVKPSVLATDVHKMKLLRIDSSSTVRPALEYVLKFLDDASGDESTKYGRTTLRAPAKLPAGYP